MNGTIIQQGRFLGTGGIIELQVRSDIDWMSIINYTLAGLAAIPPVGVEFYWQRGMEAGTGIEYKKDGVGTTPDLIVTMLTGGFTLLDTSGSPLTPINNTVTDVSNAAIPVVTNTGVNGLVAGEVVRMTNVLGAQQLGGFDFTVGHGTLSDTEFSLDYMSQVVAAAATTGGFRRIRFDPQFYPRRRFATSITQASSAVITMSVTHGFTPGQAVRLVVPAGYGMIEMNSLIGNITAVSDVNDITLNTITVDIDSTAFTPFAWPLTAAVPFTPALVVPLGETANETFANDLSDATDNQSFIGMELGPGVDGPAGSSGNQIYWRAGKSFSIDNNV